MVKVFGFVLLLAFSCFSVGSEAPSNDPITYFRISHFHHPEMPIFKKLIETTYQQLDLKVTFAELPAKRGLLQLEKGEFDADVIRIGKSIKTFNNLVLVKPALVTAEILLVCFKAVPCDKTVLGNSSKLIASNLGNQNALSSLDIQAKIVIDERNIHSIDLLRENKVDYVIYGSNEHYRKELETEFAVLVLQEEKMYHVIHSKHIQKLPMIEKALRQSLTGFDKARR